MLTPFHCTFVRREDARSYNVHFFIVRLART